MKVINLAVLETTSEKSCLYLRTNKEMDNSTFPIHTLSSLYLIKEITTKRLNVWFNLLVAINQSI